MSSFPNRIVAGFAASILENENRVRIVKYVLHATAVTNASIDSRDGSLCRATFATFRAVSVLRFPVSKKEPRRRRRKYQKNNTRENATDRRPGI